MTSELMSVLNCSLLEMSSSKIINDAVKYCCFVHKAFTRKPKPKLVLGLILVSMRMQPETWKWQRAM